MVQIKMIRVDDLIPYENNPRRNDDAVPLVKESIKEFGFRVPLVIDRENVIVTGHTRLRAAIELGIEELPCIVADDLTEEQIAAFRLVDNRVADMALWDNARLEEEIADITGINMALFGFNEKMVEDINFEKIGVKRHKCPKCGYEWGE